MQHVCTLEERLPLLFGFLFQELLLQIILETEVINDTTRLHRTQNAAFLQKLFLIPETVTLTCLLGHHKKMNEAVKLLTASRSRQIRAQNDYNYFAKSIFSC